jgi:lipopolysaccharide export system protein LptC
MNAKTSSFLQLGWNLLRDVAYRLSLYLPLLVMAVLALATYWLVRNAPEAPAIPVAQAPTHQPDYFMRDFAMRSYGASGALESELSGTHMRHFPDTETFEVDKVRVQTQQGGRLTVATAERGLSNADGSEVQLLGNAQVVRDTFQTPGGSTEPRLEFRGEFLHVFTQAEKLRSHKPVVLQRGASTFSADSLDYDRLTSVVELKGRVRGVFSAR